MFSPDLGGLIFDVDLGICISDKGVLNLKISLLIELFLFLFISVLGGEASGRLFQEEGGSVLRKSRPG